MRNPRTPKENRSTYTTERSPNRLFLWKHGWFQPDEDKNVWTHSSSPGEGLTISNAVRFVREKLGLTSLPWIDDENDLHLLD